MPSPIWQSTSESIPCEASQLLRQLPWHSLLESQSPSSSIQRFPYAQKCLSPRTGWVQQSTKDLKPSDGRHSPGIQKNPFWHSSWNPQSPSFSEQVLQLQNPISPILTMAQSTKEWVLPKFQI